MTWLFGRSQVLQKLRNDPTTAYVNRKKFLQRTTSQLELADPEAQAAVDAVLANLGKTAAGRAVAQAALDDVLRPQEMEEQEPRYGGAFRGKVHKLQKALTTVQ